MLQTVIRTGASALHPLVVFPAAVLITKTSRAHGVSGDIYQIVM
ncbi:hypothetical protein HMPREF0591_1820 [Mycobacterium parascrofulaceum ATCC BAA-614]|uniref:Uncharacterized protein n=1 Tax=Mycobacterium parascrofulaceum ATCC BAA-614 TaxID=525368 RepID=D5P6M6_9MYCO|nr:hypothetical protein HMPREF0591_1820 [Mycobacterium parascrofulaceum ATCC BAA-614]